MASGNSACSFLILLCSLTIYVGQVCNGATYVNIDMMRNKKDGNLMLMVEGMLLHLFVTVLVLVYLFHSTYIGIKSNCMYHKVLLVQFNLVVMVSSVFYDICAMSVFLVFTFPMELKKFPKSLLFLRNITQISLYKS